MIILSVESSCDETAAAVTLDGRTVLSSEVFSQSDLHALYGGVVPEIASREHIKIVDKLADTALRTAGISKPEIDAIAVTYAPGLIGALLVGVSFAKSAAFGLGVPLIPVHHMRGHIAANYIAFPELEPPFMCLVVSGGHSMIVGVDDYTSFRIIGMTRDDAAGECFDKAARVLGLGYPGGPAIDRLAQSYHGESVDFKLPIGRVDGREFDCSFSGLKTAVVNIVHNTEQKDEALDKAALAAAINRAVSAALVPRVMEASKRFGYNKIAVAGGVAANSRIRADLETACSETGIALYCPPLSLCADNAAMIGCQGYYEFLAGTRGDNNLNGVASLSIEQSYPHSEI
ncbi:MAG: tRNA (adenosine(37)-N6)-threonylcarbamoyltransferase complex transferase subunit TsaD [Oscillospiraceae bacterium]|jgi:N6-L-threonylcarbamoyladenine synthase|nr:tRNA (adenosine(37)-N6)-threonylcarbamoyltransferase complex transferase subunit TsaD [Oscillospiraceae bacterium]